MFSNCFNADEETLKLLQPYTDRVNEEYRKEVGSTEHPLDGSFTSCRRRECVLGDLVTDAMVHHVCEF